MSLYTLQDGVAVVTLDHPPVNSLGHGLRCFIVQALDAAEADAAVRAIVLTGNAKVFSAGADITELGTPRQKAEPILPEVLARLDASRKPVVAALGGLALGGGLELAMTCHARVALESASVGLPEVKLGFVPGCGGTQRLPRLVGAALAIDIMMGGEMQPVRKLAASGLFDRVVAREVVPAACDLARDLAGRPGALPRVRDLQPDADQVQAAVTAARGQLNARQRLQPVHAALLDAVQACTHPFDQGLQFERDTFLALQASRQSLALRWQFKVEREAVRLPAGMVAEPRALATVAVIGAGTMGAGIAISVLDAGLSVILLEQDAAALGRGTARVHDHYRGRVAAGKMKDSVAAAAQARLQPTLDWADLARADLVIEAVFEDLAVKQEVFRRIDAHARPGAVLASNTSYLDLDAIAQATARPQDVLGLHFFAPANVMKLLEVVRGAQTEPAALATGIELGRRLKKVAVPCGNGFGFIGNRIYNAYRRQCEFMLEDGAWPEDVDQALTDMGFAMGIFAVTDLSGLDIAWRMRKSQAATRDPRERYVSILDELCEQGRLGRKAGAGYYAYPEGRQVRSSDATVRAVIEQASARRGIVRQPLDAAAIQRRVMLAMVNEAALLLSEGVASRPGDVDVVLVQGYGFPRWEGGPVFWARQQERAQLERDLDALVAAAGFGQKRGDVGMLLA